MRSYTCNRLVRCSDFVDPRNAKLCCTDTLFGPSLTRKKTAQTTNGRRHDGLNKENHSMPIALVNHRINASQSYIAVVQWPVFARSRRCDAMRNSFGF